MSATRTALLGAAFGGASGGILGGGIAQFFFGSDTPLLPLWVAAFISAVAGGFFSAVGHCHFLATSAVTLTVIYL